MCEKRGADGKVFPCDGFFHFHCALVSQIGFAHRALARSVSVFAILWGARLSGLVVDAEIVSPSDVDGFGFAVFDLRLKAELGFYVCFERIFETKTCFRALNARDARYFPFVVDIDACGTTRFNITLFGHFGVRNISGDIFCEAGFTRTLPALPACTRRRTRRWALRGFGPCAIFGCARDGLFIAVYGTRRRSSAARIIAHSELWSVLIVSVCVKGLFL